MVQWAPKVYCTTLGRGTLDFNKQLIFRRTKQGSELLSLERSRVQDTRLGCFWSCCPWIDALKEGKTFSSAILQNSSMLLLNWEEQVRFEAIMEIAFFIMYQSELHILSAVFFSA